MVKKMRGKLRDTAGETIAEVLIALLISAIALAMLAGMIRGSSVIIERTEKKMEDYYGDFSQLQAVGASTSATGSARRTMTVHKVNSDGTRNSNILYTVYSDESIHYFADKESIGGDLVVTFK